VAEATLTGVDRIAGAFASAGREDRAALMPYMMGGFPDHDASLAIASAYADSGADLIELGVPFSDPLADGPVIHAAAVAALSAGATLDSSLRLCERVSNRVPVVLMVYANMVIAGGGVTGFAERAAAAGAAGVIVPDLPLDEAEQAREALAGAGLASVPMLAPTTPAARRARICEAASGFVYLVSDVGTTGERDRLPAGLGDLAADVRRMAAAPVAVGFGVGSPEQAASVGRVADGVIIGSRLVRAVAEAASTAEAVGELGDFLRQTRDALGAD
jgi:tryptophan synthase alpha chain